MTGRTNRLSLVGAITGQNPVTVGVLTGRRIQSLEQSKASSFSFSGTEMQTDEDLNVDSAEVAKIKAV